MEDQQITVKTPVDEMSYNQCVIQLDQILRHMQSDKCDIDRLAELTRRAAELIAACRTRLTATEAEVKTILDTLTTP